ncbi:MAG TPA: hypothetical protein VG778_09105 [Blastocatellia bacterium]|nr:hypothetical protein [Blastocatellia bacterium]
MSLIVEPATCSGGMLWRCSAKTRDERYAPPATMKVEKPRERRKGGTSSIGLALDLKGSAVFDSECSGARFIVS